MQGLNVGGGGGRSSEIKIRLIEFGSKEQYLPYEAIIGTMLHELCHNEIGPHNALFYQLLDKITLVGFHICTCGSVSVTPISVCISSDLGDLSKLLSGTLSDYRGSRGNARCMQELEEYMAKGITGTGEGFDAPSVGRLGGSGLGAHNPSPTELRSKIVQVG